MRTLHELPRFGDRWSYLYLEMGTLDQTAAGLVYRNKNGDRDVPINQLCVVLLGPGTTITHAAVKALAQNNCLLAWVGQDGVRLYAHSTGGTFSARLRPDGTIVPRNSVIAPPQNRTDLRLQQRIPLHGHASIDGIAEVFNIFNRPNWGIGIQENQTTQYLQHISAQTRTMQFGFRITY